MLGGRVAEEIIYNGVVSTGAADDLERVSELARQMVTRYGMSERLGQLTYGRSITSRFLSSPLAAAERNYSEQVAEEIDMEVRRIIDEGYDRVRAILAGRRRDLERIAEALIRKETLDRGDLEQLLASSCPV
jgi:cell division protease FtsH